MNAYLVYLRVCAAQSGPEQKLKNTKAQVSRPAIINTEEMRKYQRPNKTDQQACR